MQANNPDIHSMDAVLDNLYGAEGSPEREEFRREAYAYMMGQLICDARRQEKLTRSQLAQKVGTDKTWFLDADFQCYVRQTCFYKQVFSGATCKSRRFVLIDIGYLFEAR